MAFSFALMVQLCRRAPLICLALIAVLLTLPILLLSITPARH
jgi:hypothetical protein